MLLKGQERVGDRVGWTLKGRWRGRRVQDTSRVIIRVHFIVRLLPNIFLLLIRTQGRCCCSSQRGEGGLVRAHGGRTAVNITGFYSMVPRCNHSTAVAPRCLSSFDCAPNSQCSFQLINVSVDICTQDDIHQ